MFLAYKAKNKTNKQKREKKETVRNTVCFIKILASTCCNALVKRDGTAER